MLWYLNLMNLQLISLVTCTHTTLFIWLYELNYAGHLLTCTADDDSPLLSVPSV